MTRSQQNCPQHHIVTESNAIDLEALAFVIVTDCLTIIVLLFTSFLVLASKPWTILHVGELTDSAVLLLSLL